MDNIRIEKAIVAPLSMAYSVATLKTDRGSLIACASEGLGGCFIYPQDALKPIETVWENAGGCMTICQIATDGTFLAVQNFFKGFNAKEGILVKAIPDANGTWRVEKFMDYPYLHRFDVVDVQDQKFLVACNLCKEKAFREDWSSPGQVSIGQLKGNNDPPERMKVLIPKLTKNHGFYRGTHEGRQVLLISGMEGLYEVFIPAKAGDPWKYEQLLDREISDAVFVDIDDDGVQELVTIEEFHGDHIVINKRIDGMWQEVYRYPAPFAHVVWGGKILGKSSLLVAYRKDNGALLLMRKSNRPGGYTMDHIMIDELIAPTNLIVQADDEHCDIHCACGQTQEIVRYTLTLR